MEKNRKQMEYLNTLRFLSVVLILFTHYNYQCYSLYVNNNILSTFFYNNNLWTYIITSGITGKLALAMMCIISGFLVAKKFNKKEDPDFYKFVLNRYIRLMIPIFFIGTVYAIIRIIQNQSIGFADYISGVFWPGSIKIDDHLYCIGDFFIGNILLAIITHYTKNSKYSKLIYIPIIFVLYKIEKIWIMSTIIGGLTYELCIYLKEKNILKYWNLIFVLPISIVAISGEESNIAYFKYTIVSMIAVIYIYCLPKLQTILNFNKINKIKKYSYSMFISHGIVYSLIGEKIIKLMGFIKNDYLLEITTFIIIFIVDLIIAGIIHYVAENKMYDKLTGFIINDKKQLRGEVVNEKNK